MESQAWGKLWGLLRGYYICISTGPPVSTFVVTSICWGVRKGVGASVCFLCAISSTIILTWPLPWDKCVIKSMEFICRYVSVYPLIDRLLVASVSASLAPPFRAKDTRSRISVLEVPKYVIIIHVRSTPRYYINPEIIPCSRGCGKGKSGLRGGSIQTCFVPMFPKIFKSWLWNS